MVGVEVVLVLAEGMPGPLGVGGRASLFGIWLRERIVSVSLDWPCVAFHRVELTSNGVQLLLRGPRGVPPEAAGTAIARAIQREIQASALRSSGLTTGRELLKRTTEENYRRELL